MIPFSDNVLFNCAAVAIGVLTLLYFVLSRNFNHWKNKGVPYLKPNLFLGNCKKVFFLDLSPGQFLEYIYNQIPGAPYIGFFILGRPAILLRDLGTIKNVLIKDFNYFSDRHIDTDQEVDPVGSKILFSIKGHKWRNMRAKLTPVFTSGKMKQMFGLVTECAEELHSHLLTLKGHTEDVKMIMANYTTDVISSCAFGINSNSIKDPDAEFRKFGKNIFEFTNFRAFEFVSVFFLPSITKWARFQILSKEATVFLRKTFWDTMIYREEKKIIRNDMIDILIKIKNDSSDNLSTNVEEKENNSNLAFTKDELVAQASQFFAAGFETTASTMSFALYELCMHQDYQTKLRREIAEWLKETNGKITYEMVHKMKYLDMVISETLRKYPPLPFLDRITMQDYKIPGTGIILQKDTPVFISIVAHHYDEEFFPDPERFDPERFNETNKKNIKPYSYLPFGEGPRNCIGERFGMMSLKTGLVYILSQFQVQKCRNTPEKLEIEPKGLITASVGGIPLSLIKSIAQ